MSEQTFGEWLTAEMEARRWTPAQLARKSGLSSVEAFLSDRSEPSYVARIRLARGLNLPEAIVHQRYAEGRAPALERARAAKVQQVIQDFRSLLAFRTSAQKTRWQEQVLLGHFETLPPDDRVEVLTAVADSPYLREDFLAQLNALLPEEAAA
jgi:transcriptional regulator with XRE-family HTH domain